MDQSKVLVLMATYNGEAYVRQMVDSVLNQDYPDIHIVLSDDHSSDGTVTILDEYAANYPDKVTHYRSGQRFGCAQKHFMHLLRQFCDASYIMFCDQDDVWHSNKISLTLAKMHQIEADPQIPAMVHTDLRVVDRDLKELAPSFCAHSALDGNRMALNQLLVQNVVTGCTMMINRTLAKLACREIPMESVMMHDWWIALLASAFGKVGFVTEATIDYRQHGKNSVGAKNVYSVSYLWSRLRSAKMRQSLINAAKQADAFLAAYADLLNPQQKLILQDFAQTQNASLWRRNRIYRKHKLYKYGFVRIAAQFIGW